MAITYSVMSGQIVGDAVPDDGSGVPPGGAVVETGQQIPVEPFSGNTASYQGTVNVDPETNAVSVQLPATVAIVSNGDQLTVIDQGGSNVQGPVAISAGVVDEIALPPDHCIVADGQQITMTVDGVQKVVTMTVAGGVITAETTADPA